MVVCAATNVEASNNAGVVLSRVESHDGVEGTELQATERDDSSDGHAKTSVQGKEALEASSRLIKIEQTFEGLISRANIRRKALSGIVQRIHDRKIPCCCQTIRSMFTEKNMPKFCFGPYFGNVNLPESLKYKLKACVGKYRMQFVKLTRQKSRGALFAVNAREIFPGCRKTAAPSFLGYGLALWV